MKISTKLFLAVFVPVLVALAVGLTVFISYRALETAQESGDKVRLIRDSITEINHRVFSYVTYPEERQKQQFLAEYQKMTALLADVRFRNPDQQQLHKEIRLNGQSLKEDFLRLVANTEHPGPAGSDKLLRETEELLEGQLLTRSRKTDSIASTLQSLVDDDIRNTQKREITLIFLVLGLTTFPLIVGLTRMRKRITTALTKLHQGTEIIRTGNLDYVIKVERKDEIGNLTHAFNRMTADLKEVTASKTDLEQEMAERKRAEESLKKAHGELEIKVAERTEELMAEIEQRKRTEDALRESEEELRYLSSQLLVAQEKERREIAEDLHDNTWQILNTIKIDIDQLLSPKISGDLTTARSIGKRIIANIRVAIEKIRTIQGDLWPPLIDDIGLLATINWYSRKFENSHAGMTIEKQIAVTEEDVPEHLKIVIYRVMQEALKNAAQHSVASRVLVSLKKEGPGIEFAVIDNGRGFDLEQILFRARPWTGFGIMGLKERIEHSGGIFDVSSREGIGTTIRASWPLTGEDQEIPDRRPIKPVFEKQEQPFRMVTEAISDWVYSMRLEPDDRFVCDWTTPGFTLVTGHGVDADLAEIVHHEDKAIAEERFRNILALRPYVSEYRIVTKSGETCWVRDSIYPVADPLHSGTIKVIGAAQNITERKQTERELFELNQRLQALMQAVPVGISFSDDLTCRHITGNPALLAQFEMKPDDNVSASAPDAGAAGRRVRYFRDEQEIREVELPLQRAVMEDKVIAPMELEVRLPSGRRWYTEASGAPVRDAQGKVIGGIAVTVDITERKKAEAEIRRQVDELRAMNEELARFNQTAVDRELRMIELKKQINALCLQASQSPRYPLDFGKDDCMDITERKQTEKALRASRLAALNLMEDAVEARQKAEQISAELEARVQKRTAELSNTVYKLQKEILQRRGLEAKLRESEKQIRFFASQCLTAQETERKRIAAELHDSIVASLAAIKFSIEKTQAEMERGLATPDSLQSLVTTVQQTIVETRKIMADLRPAILDDLGIVSAINWFCREFQKTYSHIRIESEIGLSEGDLPDSLKTPVFRISQEALNNIAKYSQAGLVRLFLRKADERINLTIEDNGRGFDLNKVVKGFGLSTMRERAELSGGTFAVESRAGGTIIRVSWPSG